MADKENNRFCRKCQFTQSITMLKIPDNPNKYVTFDDTHPFVLNAIKERKHFEQCWCGSGRKFKKCHMLRAQGKPNTLGQIQNLHQKYFWRKRGCMHPLASTDSCNGKVIDSHTIQRKGPLKKIIDETGHVLHFEINLNSGKHELSNIGWRKASVFPGYCSTHDSKLFSPIEKESFKGEHWHCVLLAFRNVCNELYRKTAMIEALESLRPHIDQGLDIHGQIKAQLHCIKNIENQSIALNENAYIRDKFETAIIQNNWEEFESKCYFFKGKIDVVSASAIQSEFCFDGKKYYDMWDPKSKGEILSHSIINTEDGGAIVFVWLKDENDPKSVVKSFDKLPAEEKGDIFVQYCFLNAENTFFSKQWWDKLNNEQKSTIQKYSETLYYNGGKFVANEDKLVDWNFD